jgi:putative glutathione S-transferase
MMSQLAPRDRQGAYVRPESEFRLRVSGAGPFLPEADRYVLIVGMGCPWAHRTLVTRALKGLETAIAVVKVIPSPEAGGWIFPEPFFGCSSLRELYLKAKPGYQGRSTVPVLWDTQTQSIVNNESAEIIVLLNESFHAVATHSELDLYPDPLRPTIDDWNQRIYHAINNGVYRCGFAQTQAAYTEACQSLFTLLDELDQVLATQRYVCGDRITLVDVRLYPTLFRFDTVYYPLFNCNVRRIRDYPNLGPYLQDLYQSPGVATTGDLTAVKQEYFGNLFPLNPGGIIPLGPDQSWLEDPHGRDRFVPK